MTKQFVLFEHAVGYALFKVKEVEEIGSFIAEVESSITDLSRFNSVVKLTGFSPFKSGVNALENINAVSEGIVSDDLQLFLETQLPKTGKQSKIVLGVADPKLGASINEITGIQCSHTGIFPEVIRGIRFHFPKLIKGFTSKSSATAQLGLGHSYSRAKIKFNVHRADNMIIQSISLLDQLDKDVNTYTMLIREAYSYHFPELIKIVPDNLTYVKLMLFIKNKKDLNEDKLEGLEEITMDSAKAQAILSASRSSMGADVTPEDLENIEMFAERVVGMATYRDELDSYLSTKMGSVAPNLATLVGDQVGARLISHAGSLTNLAKYPASTVQILGAEKALFRALKSRSNTPKYGLLYHSTFIGRAAAKNKGRVSRYLANKCSIASRIDCFADVPTNVFGLKLREQVEERLKFYEVGEIPRKNIDVMKEAIESFNDVVEEMKKKEKKKKKKKKRKLSETQETVEEMQPANGEAHEEENGEEPVKKKKKKKKNKDKENEE